ncbi:MAG: hypothetical protein QNJ46_30290 [Leptolyngbyaceae cyanobacterium MO_188.B28]|nr:hypothetical protein [Leptolyngbyaceae cyanobacterium MO_188.B28]
MNFLDSWDSSYRNNLTTKQEDLLYRHLWDCVRTEPADDVLNRFRRLFIEARGYGDPQVWRALTRIINAPGAEKTFKYTLNRCCYTVINPWQTDVERHAAIPKLVALFEEIPDNLTRSTLSNRIRMLVRKYTQTEQYAALHRLPHVLIETEENKTATENNPVGTLIRRYPYIYDYSLLTEDSGHAQKYAVKSLRKKAERRFGVELIRYNSSRLGYSSGEYADNPTLLSDEELNSALEYYTGKIEGNWGHRDLAMWFSTYSQTVSSYREFKAELSDYLISPLATAMPKYLNNCFSRQLRQYLKNMLSDFDAYPLNDFVLVETCRRLLNFLVVESAQRPAFQTFRHLIREIGFQLTIGLLLRIVLLCSAAKPWLERCFSILFNLHERYLRSDVPWLVTSLEHVNIALSSNFGGPQLWLASL